MAAIDSFCQHSAVPLCHSGKFCGLSSILLSPYVFSSCCEDQQVTVSLE